MDGRSHVIPCTLRSYVADDVATKYVLTYVTSTVGTYSKMWNLYLSPIDAVPAGPCPACIRGKPGNSPKWYFPGNVSVYVYVLGVTTVEETNCEDAKPFRAEFDSSPFLVNVQWRALI